MEIESINTKANAGLSLGIIGTALGVLTGGAGVLGVHNRNGGDYYRPHDYVTKDELNYVQQLAAKDSQIAILTSEQNTEVKIADVFERVMTRVNQNQRDQAAWNAEQSVANARISAAIATNRESISDLNRTCNELTRTVIPAERVCPRPMPLYNSWTAPTGTAEAPVTGGGTQ